MKHTRSSWNTPSRDTKSGCTGMTKSNYKNYSYFSCAHGITVLSSERMAIELHIPRRRLLIWTWTCRKPRNHTTARRSRSWRSCRRPSPSSRSRCPSGSRTAARSSRTRRSPSRRRHKQEESLDSWTNKILWTEQITTCSICYMCCSLLQKQTTCSQVQK